MSARALALLLAAGCAVFAAGCSFVKMDPGADEVRVVGPGQLPAGCVKRGEVEVSVKDNLGPYSRDEMRVKDELEVLARNEASSLNANTLQPKGPPLDGEQRFVAFRCPVGAISSAMENAAPPGEPGAAETSPLKDE